MSNNSERPTTITALLNGKFVMQIEKSNGLSEQDIDNAKAEMQIGMEGKQLTFKIR